MSNSVKKNVYASITVVFWALAFPLTRLVVSDMGSITVGTVRCTVAAVVLLIIGKVLHIRKPFKISHLGLFFVEGLMGFFSIRD